MSRTVTETPRISLRHWAASLTLAASLAAPAAAGAQGLTVKAGVNIAKLRLLPDNPAVTPLIGFVGGIAVQPRVKFLPGLQIEVLWSRRGVRTAGPLDFRIDYLAVPILERIRVPKLPFRLHGFIGPELAFRVNATLRSGASAPVDFKQFITRRDVSIVAGVDVEIRRVVVDVRYTLGGTNIAADPAQLGDRWKSRAISLMAGWRFR